jgi:hypothetical protein
MIVKLNKIIEDIYKMNSSEISQIIEAVKLRRNQLHTMNAGSFRIGDKVSFEGRGGRIVTGTVQKIKIKYVLIDAGIYGRWNVPGSHLTLVKEVVNA